MNGGKLAGGNPKNGRVENDFYATNPTAVEMLLLTHRFNFERVLEPCVGNGNIANIIRYRHPGADITAVDIVDRGYPKTIVEDFLEWKTEKTFDTIITNPPFSLAGEFIEKSMTLLAEGGNSQCSLKYNSSRGKSGNACSKSSRRNTSMFFARERMYGRTDCRTTMPTQFASLGSFGEKDRKRSR